MRRLRPALPAARDNVTATLENRMICNLLPRTSGRSSAAFSFSALLSGTAKSIASIRPTVCVALLVVLGGALCGSVAQAQTAYFGGAQTTLISGLSGPQGIAMDASGDIFYAQYSEGSAGVYEIPAGCTSSSCIKTISNSGL